MSYRPTYVVKPDMDAATVTTVQALNAHAMEHASALAEIIAHCKRLKTSAALYSQAGWLQGQVYADGYYHLSLAPPLPPTEEESA